MRFHVSSGASGLPCLAAALALCAGRIHAQQPHLTSAPDTMAVVVECRIGDVAARVMEAHARGDTLFLSAASLLALAGFDSVGVTGERSLEAASALLHADASFDLGALVVQFADSGTLPVSRRATRARARAALRDRERTSRMVVTPARLALVPSALTVSYSAQRDGAVAIDAASRAFSGTFEGALTRGPRGGAHITLGWMRIPSDPTGGIRVRIGTLDELAGASGVLVTNVPLQRSDTLRVSAITTAAMPGTEFELFEDGELVAADSVDSAGALRLRLAHHHGTHVVRLVAHDPAGGERESRWVESTPDALLSRGALQYTVAAGRCARRSCTAALARVAYAPTDGLTVGVALSPPTSGSVGAAPVLRGTLDARIGESAVLTVLRGSTAAATAELRLERAAGRSFVLRSSAAGTLAASPLLPVGMGTTRRLSSAAGTWMLPRLGSLDLAGAFTPSAVAVASAASVPMRIGVVQMSVAMSREGTAAACLDWRVGAVINGSWLSRTLASLRSALLRVREGERPPACGGSSRSVLLVLPIAPTSALELSASWNRARGGRRPLLAAALRRRIGRFMTAHAELTGGDGPHASRSGIAGSVVLDALRRSISLGDPTDVGGTVDGLVYADDNANGRRDATEPTVAGALIRSDDASGVSDARGLFVLTGLPPDRLARLSVDSLSIEDAGFVPTLPVGVVLTARTIVRVDVPVRRREVAAP